MPPPHAYPSETDLASSLTPAARCYARTRNDRSGSLMLCQYLPKTGRLGEARICNAQKDRSKKDNASMCILLC